MAAVQPIAPKNGCCDVLVHVIVHLRIFSCMFSSRGAKHLAEMLPPSKDV